MASDKILEFYKEHYGKLVGKKVEALVHDGVNTEFSTPLMGLLFDDKTIAWIMCDEEGNGPGFLDIQEDK